MATTPRPAPKTARQRVFEHWVFMLGKNPKRCALGPARQVLIDKALALYGGDEEVAMLAIEGVAASAFHAGENDRGQPYDDIGLILRDEAHIERYAALGQKLRDQVQADAQAAQSAAPVSEYDESPEALARCAAAREKLRAMAASCSGRAIK